MLLKYQFSLNSVLIIIITIIFVSSPRVRRERGWYLWGQFLPRPSVALVVIFGLESPTLEGKPSSLHLIRHEPMVEEYR